MDLKTYLQSGEKGSAKKLAEALGVSASYMSQMKNGDAPISPRRAVDIERATAGVVTRRDLLPDKWERIWPELAEQVAA